jgi:imidazolonepropionase-like amidohydrolase
VDFHVHLNDESELLSYLAYGVTTVVNLQGSPEHLALRESVARGEVLGPWIVTSGPILDGDPPIRDSPGTTVVADPAAAREAVAAQARAGYDLIKVYNNLDPAALRAAVEEAEGQGLVVVGHIPRNPDRATALQKTLDAGMAMIAHGEEVFFTYLGGAGDASMGQGPQPVEPARIREAAQLVAEAGAAVTPNLSFIAMTARMLEDVEAVLEGHPESRYLSPAVRQTWREQNPTHRDDLDRFAAREAIKGPAVRALTLELQRAGVLLLLGSDASTPGLYPGWSAILELEELVGAGLTPFEALSTGTRNAGEFLMRNVPGARPIGTIEAGKAADLVLVEGNPLEDVSVMRDPAGVVLGGRWFPREDLESRRSAAP